MIPYPLLNRTTTNSTERFLRLPAVGNQGQENEYEENFANTELTLTGVNSKARKATDQLFKVLMKIILHRSQQGKSESGQTHSSKNRFLGRCY